LGVWVGTTIHRLGSRRESRKEKTGHSRAWRDRQLEELSEAFKQEKMNGEDNVRARDPHPDKFASESDLGEQSSDIFFYPWLSVLSGLKTSR
jgi:hypothetical protein